VQAQQTSLLINNGAQICKNTTRYQYSATCSATAVRWIVATDWQHCCSRTAIVLTPPLIHCSFHGLALGIPVESSYLLASATGRTRNPKVVGGSWHFLGGKESSAGSWASPIKGTFPRLGKEEIVFPHKENKTGRSNSFPMLHVVTGVNYCFFSHTANSYTGKTVLFPTWEKHLLILPLVPLRQSWLALFPLNVSPLDRLPWGFCFFL